LKESIRKFHFVAPLEQVARGGYYDVPVPLEISRAIGKRGPIPVSVLVNNVASFNASLSPAGGGRHRLRLNAGTREEAAAKVGDPVKIKIAVRSQPLKVTIPGDLKTALRGEGILEYFETLAPGKQDHIIHWIDHSVRPETRKKRIQYTVEITHARFEKRRNR
jgi:Bacteriocin-protection, YdeI or OmpD-Associated/Domain of unknown function (DUF1905)